MARTVADIRSDIERAVNARARIYRRQGEVATPELSEQRAVLDHRISRLWEELRHARTGVVSLVDFTPNDVRRIIRHNPRLVLA